MEDKNVIVSMTSTLTTVVVHGTEQSLFEVYADASMEQTLGYIVDSDRARYLVHGPKLHESHSQLLACLKSAVALLVSEYPASQQEELGVNKMAKAIENAGKVFWA